MVCCPTLWHIFNQPQIVSEVDTKAASSLERFKSRLVPKGFRSTSRHRLQTPTPVVKLIIVRVLVFGSSNRRLAITSSIHQECFCAKSFRESVYGSSYLVEG